MQKTQNPPVYIYFVHTSDGRQFSTEKPLVWSSVRNHVSRFLLKLHQQGVITSEELAKQQETMKVHVDAMASGLHERWTDSKTVWQQVQRHSKVVDWLLKHGFISSEEAAEKHEQIAIASAPPEKGFTIKRQKKEKAQ